MNNKNESKRKRARRKSISKSSEWSVQEKQKFVTALNKGPPFRRQDGNINWPVLRKFIGTKSLEDVKDFARRFNALEHGDAYPEFSTKAAIDVWRQLAENVMDPGDNLANICVPQVMTVAALEPVLSSCESSNAPNYNNIYSYLSAAMRGTDLPELPASDAVVILDLLEDLIHVLSQSETLIQREFMHTRYAELRENMFTDSNSNEKPGSSSTNPYRIPFDILNFREQNNEFD